MIETVTFPVRFCGACARDVVVARDLDADDAWVDVCTRCSATLPTGSSRQLSASALTAMGYEVEGEGGIIGCGSGGCASCATTSQTTSGCPA